MIADLRGLPPHIGRYEVRGLLGRGGMGRVIAGHDPVLRRSVAIKLIEPSAVDLDSLAEMRFLFHREARAIARLKHPSVIEIFDYSGPEAELMFLACELVDGPTVREVLDERGALHIRAAAALGYELAGALGHAHSAGIIHRDLKPENIFWTREGRVIVADFGIAKAFEDPGVLGSTVQYGATQLYGSPAFLAPEQLTGGSIGPATDLWALGCILYESLSGQAAFDGPDVPAILESVAEATPRALGDLVAVPPMFADLVGRLLCREAKHRPDTADDVAQSLRRILDGLEVSDPRLELRGFGGETAPHPPHADDTREQQDETTSMFSEPERHGIHVRHAESPWASVLQKGPVVLAMIGFAIALASGVHMFKKMSSLADNGDAFMPATVTTDPDSLPRLADSEDVFVLVTFSGSAEISIDGRPVGTWSDTVRMAMPPGRHTIVAKTATTQVSREVLLVADTQPTFDLTPPHEASSDEPP